MTTKNLTWVSWCGMIELTLPIEAVLDCSHPGPCDDDVEFWQSQISVSYSRDILIEHLMEYGAWMRKDLAALSDDELHQKIIWLAACDLREELS
jgi:hypothetical protein